MTSAIATCVLSGLTFALVSSTRLPLPVRAQSTSPANIISNSSNQKQVQFNPPDFSDVGRPRRRTSGGSRGPCRVADQPPLTALVPDTSIGLTLATSPNFLFYVPYALTNDHSVEFVLKDDQNNQVYITKFPGNETPPGIVNLQLPSTVSLEANKNYDWYFLIHCDAQNQDRFVYVNGLIRRVERPDMETQLTSVPSQERATQYASEGIWYEAVNSLAEQLRVSPQNSRLKEDWVTLLQSVGLEHLASEPLVPCCTFER